MRLIFISSIALLLGLFLSACEGFKLTGSMCESLEPGQVLSECKAYNEEEAKKASVPIKNNAGECLECQSPKDLEIRQ